MNKFEKCINNAELSETGEVYYRNIKVINEGEQNEYYIDPRTKRNEDNLFVVTPFCFYNSHYWYVCPDCNEIHYAYFLGKSQTGCCVDIDCQRFLCIDNTHFLIQREPIIINDKEVSDL